MQSRPMAGFICDGAGAAGSRKFERNANITGKTVWIVILKKIVFPCQIVADNENDK